MVNRWRKPSQDLVIFSCILFFFFFFKLLLLDNFVWAAPGRVALFDHVAVISLLFSPSSEQCPPIQTFFFLFFHIYIPMIWG